MPEQIQTAETSPSPRRRHTLGKTAAIAVTASLTLGGGYMATRHNSSRTAGRPGAVPTTPGPTPSTTEQSTTTVIPTTTTEKLLPATTTSTTEAPTTTMPEVTTTTLPETQTDLVTNPFENITIAGDGGTSVQDVTHGLNLINGLIQKYESNGEPVPFYLANFKKYPIHIVCRASGVNATNTYPSTNPSIASIIDIGDSQRNLAPLGDPDRDVLMAGGLVHEVDIIDQDNQYAANNHDQGLPEFPRSAWTPLEEHATYEAQKPALEGLHAHSYITEGVVKATQEEYWLSPTNPY